MENVLLNSSVRKEVGKGPSHRVREMGHVPGVIYGHHFANYPLEFNTKEIMKILRQHGDNAIINVMVNGISYPAIIKEVQRDPVSGELLHIDLQQINTSEKISTTVPIILAGRRNIQNEGILQQQIQKIEIECYPDKVPENVTLDVSNLNVGDSIKISDVEFSEEVAILNDNEEVIASLSPIREEEEELEDDTYHYTEEVEEIGREVSDNENNDGEEIQK